MMGEAGCQPGTSAPVKNSLSCAPCADGKFQTQARRLLPRRPILLATRSSLLPELTGAVRTATANPCTKRRKQSLWQSICASFVPVFAVQLLTAPVSSCVNWQPQALNTVLTHAPRVSTPRSLPSPCSQAANANCDCVQPGYTQAPNRTAQIQCGYGTYNNVTSCGTKCLACPARRAPPSSRDPILPGVPVPPLSILRCLER